MVEYADFRELVASLMRSVTVTSSMKDFNPHAHAYIFLMTSTVAEASCPFMFK